MPRIYLVKIYKIKSVAEVVVIANNNRQAIKKVREGKIAFGRKTKFKKPIVNPIYLAFEFPRNKKMER